MIDLETNKIPNMVRAEVGCCTVHVARALLVDVVMLIRLNAHMTMLVLTVLNIIVHIHH